MNVKQYSSRACTEVWEFLNYLSPEEYIQIPQEVIEEIQWNTDADCHFSFDPQKKMEKQGFSKEAFNMILEIYQEFFEKKI